MNKAEQIVEYVTKKFKPLEGNIDDVIRDVQSILDTPADDSLESSGLEVVAHLFTVANSHGYCCRSEHTEGFDDFPVVRQDQAEAVIAEGQAQLKSALSDMNELVGKLAEQQKEIEALKKKLYIYQLFFCKECNGYTGEAENCDCNKESVNERTN